MTHSPISFVYITLFIALNYSLPRSSCFLSILLLDFDATGLLKYPPDCFDYKVVNDTVGYTYQGSVVTNKVYGYITMFQYLAHFEATNSQVSRRVQ